MAKLILSLDGQLIKEFTLSKERTTIGRKPHNDIQIDNLAVSGEHAVIMTILNDSFLEDLGSTNGTLVNGQPAKSTSCRATTLSRLASTSLNTLMRRLQSRARPILRRLWCCDPQPHRRRSRTPKRSQTPKQSRSTHKIE